MNLSNELWIIQASRSNANWMTFLVFSTKLVRKIRSRDSRQSTRRIIILAHYLGLESIRVLPMIRLLRIGLMMIRSRVGGIGGSWVYIVGHLAREKRARRLGSAAPYTDYLFIYHAAGGHHLTFASYSSLQTDKESSRVVCDEHENLT